MSVSSPFQIRVGFVFTLFAVICGALGLFVTPIVQRRAFREKLASEGIEVNWNARCDDDVTYVNLIGTPRIIPMRVFQFRSLSYLAVSDIEIHVFPGDIATLDNLRELYFCGTDVTTVPPHIGRLQKLEKLWLGRTDSGNRLRSIPEEVGRLSRLSVLSLSDNELSSIPAEIGHLSNLRLLLLNGNELDSLPSSITGLSRLNTLDISRNKFHEVPEEVTKLRNLTTLYANDNRIACVASQIGMMSNLEVLDLDDNQLETLPPEIGQLTKLSWLHLARNNIAILPREIGQLRDLKDLSLRNNAIGDTDIRHLYSLKRLLLLDLRGTNVSKESVLALKEQLPTCSVESDFGLLK